MLATTFFLLFAQTGWEHYLTALFLPVAFWLACWEDPPRGVRRTVSARVVLSLAQNRVFTLALARSRAAGSPRC